MGGGQNMKAGHKILDAANRYWVYYTFCLFRALHFSARKRHPLAGFGKKTRMCWFLIPQKEMVARRLLSSGGAHLLQIPWQAG